MQSDALNKQILHDQFEKSEPHGMDLINYLKNLNIEKHLPLKKISHQQPL